MADGSKEEKKSRFLIHSSIDNYHPWRGYKSTDLLNGNDYLLFSLQLPKNLSISLADLNMRGRLFSNINRGILPILSLEKNKKEIFFLLPNFSFKPLTDYLNESTSDKSLELLKNLVRTLILSWNMGLYFHNLTPESIIFVDESPRILPTAYLLPAMIMDLISNTGDENINKEHPLFKDLNDMGKLFVIFSNYLKPGDSNKCGKISETLQILSADTTPEIFFKTIESVKSFLGIKEGIKILPVSGGSLVTPSTKIKDKLKETVLGFSSNNQQLMILKGDNGDGKSCMLEIARRLFLSEADFKGNILSHSQIFSDKRDVEALQREKIDCVFIDDHVHDPLLSGQIVCKILEFIKKGMPVVCISGENTPDIFIQSTKKECERKGFPIREIILPSPGKTDKIALFSKRLAANNKTELNNQIDMNQAKLSLLPYLHMGAKQEPGGNLSLSELLEPLDRSVLNFIAVFRFEIPLMILQKVYLTTRDEFYKSLQHLINLGMINISVGKSSLSKGDFCLLFTLSSRSLLNNVLDSIPADRKNQLHSNIAFILKEYSNIPSTYILYHLACSGNKTEAAARYYNTFRRFLGEKQAGAITCLYENFIQTGLDAYLPLEMYSKLLIEIGSFYSLSGQLTKAEGFFKSCRKKINKANQSHKLRAIIVEAIRKECEIYEKRGRFLKAETLLKKAINFHQEHITVKEHSKLINDLAWIYYRLGQFDKSWENCLAVQKNLDKKQYPSELAQSYNLMGTINWNRSKYEEAIMCHTKCLNIREENNDTAGLASSFNNLGLVYRSTGRIKEAIECFTKSMKIKQKNNNIPGLAATHLNISLTYLDIEDFEKAEINCEISCNFAEETGNQQILAETYGTMGDISYLKEDYEMAANYYSRDLRICQKTKSVREEAVVLRRLGQLNLATGQTNKTKELLEKARKLNLKIGSHLETALLNCLEGKLKIKTGKRDEGIAKLEGVSVELSLLGKKNTAAKIFAELGELYLKENNEVLAREYLLRSTSLTGRNEAFSSRILKLQESLDLIYNSEQTKSEKDSDNYKTLCRLISMFRTTQDTEKLYNTIIETALKTTKSERGLIALRDNQTKSYRILASTSDFIPGEQIEDINIISILNIAGHLGYPLDTIQINIPLNKVSDEFIEKYPRIICIPLKVNHEIKGCLYLDSTKSRIPHASGQRRLMLALTQQFAIGLEKAFLTDIISSSEKIQTQKIIKTPERNKNYENIIRISSSMRLVCELIDGIKEMDTTVLLTGESGTGKDLIAKTIHYSSIRRNSPLHTINCSALPRELLESELFGHEKGAFTGAHKQKIGHFESAGDGTIFLNEIGDLPLSLQPKLLHVLEERIFFRVGGTKKIETKARIVTATNKNLLELVKQGLFREDLYYRINIFPIKMPSLKDRREDIKPLCDHFIELYCKLYNMPVKKFSPEAMMYLEKYPWPGNVRQLESIIIRLIIVSGQETITDHDLPKNIFNYSNALHAGISSTIDETIKVLLDNMNYSPNDPILPKIEGSIIKKIVEMTKDKTKAASILGISKPTLYSRLKKYEKKN